MVIANNKLIYKSNKKNNKMQTDQEKKQDAEVNMNLGLISASQSNKQMKQLEYQREKVLREDGPNSERAKRIDKLMNEKAEELKKQLNTLAKSTEFYAKEVKDKKKQSDDERKTQNIEREYDDTLSDEYSNKENEVENRENHDNTKSINEYIKNDKKEEKQRIIDQKA